MEEMFIQTDEQRAIVESVKRFVEQVVTPKAPALLTRRQCPCPSDASHHSPKP